MTHIYHFMRKPYKSVRLDVVFCKVNRFLENQKEYKIKS